MTLQSEQYARAWASGFVEGRRGVFVPLALIDVCEGNFYDAMMLSQIVYWCTPGSSGETKLRRRHQGELWIAKRHHEWHDETRVKERTARECLKRLRQKGLVHYTLVGEGHDLVPYLRVNWENLGRALLDVHAREVEDDAQEDEGEMSHVRQSPISEPKNALCLTSDVTRLTCDDTRLTSGARRQTCASYIAKNTSIEQPITTPPTTHHAARDSALEGVEAELAVPPSRGGKATNKAAQREKTTKREEQAKKGRASKQRATRELTSEIEPASKPYTTQDYQALVEAIPTLLEVSPALARRYASLLLGNAKTGEWGACKLEAPMLVGELRAFVDYYRARYPELSLPKSPRALHQHVHEFREARAKERQARQLREARERARVDMFSEEEARKVREMLESGGLCTTNV